MATVMTNMRISQDKVQLAMARKAMNPYDLCSAAGISYLPNSIREYIKETPSYPKIQERYQSVKNRDIFSSVLLSFPLHG